MLDLVGAGSSGLTARWGGQSISGFLGGHVSEVSLSQGPVWLGVPRAFYVMCTRWAKALGVLNTPELGPRARTHLVPHSQAPPSTFTHSLIHSHVYTVSMARETGTVCAFGDLRVLSWEP